jgi:hypothetical protein
MKDRDKAAELNQKADNLITNSSILAENVFIGVLKSLKT